MLSARTALAMASLLSTTIACRPSADSGDTIDLGTDTGDTGEGPDDGMEAWLDASLVEQVAAIEGGTISGASLLEAYLERIAERDEGDEGINSIIALDPDATEAASSLDALAGSDALLQGAVVLVKDNIDTAGLATTAGSLALEGNIPAADARIVAAIREANALMLGKANLSEWANFRGENSTNGWSSLGGLTLNGYDPDYNPCGSSSGSAAAVAAGLASASIGTETDGSIVCPASMNGVVGFKPTVGLVSRGGVIPISASQDTAGPITRTVADAARLLTAMAGEDDADSATEEIPDGFSLDFEASLDPDSLDGARLGIVKNYVGRNSDIDALFDEACAELEAAGATLVEVSFWMDYKQEEWLVLLTEFKVGINEYLASHETEGQPASLTELIAWNEAHADEVMPWFGQEYFEEAEETGGLEDPDYLAAVEHVWTTIGEEGIVASMTDNELDAFIAPTAGPAFVTDLKTGDQVTIPVASSPAAAIGAPHLTVPMGLVDDLPIGLSFFANQWQDAEVLSLGYAYEQLRDRR